MVDVASFTKLENEVIHRYRHDLSHAESVEDVKKFFAYTAMDFLQRALDGRVDIDYDDIKLAPNGANPYQLSQRLQGEDNFSMLWKRSDMPSILERFANTAVNRLTHIDRNPAKSEAKIHRH